MEQMNFNQEPESVSAFKQFYSSDPYEVLGVSRTATKEEMEKVRKQLQMQFHPDRNTDPKALEIFQNIEEAFNKINPKPKQEQGGEYVNEEDVLKNLNDSYFFGRFMSKAHNSGIKTWQILKVVETEHGQEILKEGFSKNLKSYIGKPHEFSKYMLEWKDQGIAVEKFLNQPEVLSLLENSVYSIPNEADQFERFASEWKQLNIDVSSILQFSKFKETIENRVGYFFKNKEFVYEPKKVAEYIEGWNKLGLLKDILNSQKINQIIEEKLSEWNMSPSYEQREAYEFWVLKGWKPNPKIEEKYNRKASQSARGASYPRNFRKF